MLNKFLEKKPLFYNEIDYTRMPRVYEKIKTHIASSNIIHIIGTNGKGTTGRFLATAIYASGKKIGHYTSPHILEFNERIWINGSNSTDKELESAHQKLQTILDKNDLDSLSYFEYTTFLAMMVFKECDYIVLEAGLGGEYDATAVFENILTLVTPIDIDHESFLGKTIDEIAITKLNALQKSVILGEQKHKQVEIIAKNISNQKNANFYNFKDILSSSDYENIEQIATNLGLAKYLISNLKLSISALKFLGIKYKNEYFDNSKLFGRLSKITDNIFVDVGHNPLAALSIVDFFKDEKIVLIYNTYKDKNYKEILSILKPIINHVEIIKVCDDRIADIKQIQYTLKELNIKFVNFKGTNEMDKYLVFGSFSVVETFLRLNHE